MRNLVLFFIKYNAFFVFILLEIISFYLVVNNNEKQNQVFVSSANQMTGSFYERYDKIVSYWNLGDVNAELANDNKRLMEQLPNAYFADEVDTVVYNMFTIEQVMAKKLITVSSDTTIKEVAEILAEKEFHALPVVDNEILVGIVTTTDLIKYLINQY